MPTQAQSGKAFEYALITAARHFLEPHIPVRLIDDTVYQTTRDCYHLYSDVQQRAYNQAADAAIRHISSLEPHMLHPLSAGDVMELRLMPDVAGQHGDVRDLLLSSGVWEIGISAKNNHMAVKHSRLSDVLDFGNSWVGVPCSQSYFDTITPVFARLRTLRTEEALWRNVPDKHRIVYMPILEAFRSEIMLLTAQNPGIPQRLVSYLIGNRDFYKVIKRKGVTEIYGFNMHGSLNRHVGVHRPVIRVQQPLLPTQILTFTMKPKSTDTLLMNLDNGWGISFRIHNAESRVVPSLKFDVNLFGLPQRLYSHNEIWH